MDSAIKKDIEIFNNPATRKIFIYCRRKVNELFLLNANNEALVELKEPKSLWFEISIENFERGTYILTTRSESNFFTYKINID